MVWVVRVCAVALSNVEGLDELVANQRKVYEVVDGLVKSQEHLLTTCVGKGTPHSSQKRYYIHKFFVFGIHFPEKLHFSVTQENIHREFISRKLHITYSFVIQKITWKNCFGNYLFGKCFRS